MRISAVYEHTAKLTCLIYCPCLKEVRLGILPSSHAWYAHIVWLLKWHDGMANRPTDQLSCLTEISHATFEQSSSSVMLEITLCPPLAFCKHHGLSGPTYGTTYVAWNFKYPTCAICYVHCFVLCPLYAGDWDGHHQLVGQSVSSVDHFSVGLAQAHSN